MLINHIHFMDIPFFLWEFPQNLLGTLLFLVMKTRGSLESVTPERRHLFIRGSIGISLGFFVFWNHDPANAIFHLPTVNRDHEFGHSLQSRMLGPLYLPIIGIPSVLRVLYARWYFHRHGRRWDGYYRGYPENWADRLGGVDSTIGERIS